MRPRHLLYAGLIAGLVAGLVAAAASAQQPPAAAPCSAPEYRQFDFWVGRWDARWTDAQGTPARGSNRVEKTLDGCVIVEHFDGAPGSPLKGTSVSTYDRGTALWKQTWVDNTGAYLDFTGAWRDGRMTLSRKAVVQGKPALQRMVFRDIGAQRFTWDWEVSSDDGATWTTQWRIEYTRAAP